MTPFMFVHYSDYVSKTRLDSSVPPPAKQYDTLIVSRSKLDLVLIVFMFILL